MASRAAQVGDRISRLLAAPVGLGELAAAGAALIALGTLYCQIYCATAYHPMHGALMPLRYSLAWAIGAILPWVVAFELCKPQRLPAMSSARRSLAIAACFGAAAFLSIVLERGLDQLVSAHTRPLQMQIAAQMPSAALVGFLLILGRGWQPSARPVEAISGEPLIALLAMAPGIDWVEAAGNYVQVHAAGRTSLHRVTMREVEASLDRRSFARIHRSTIVALAAVDARILIGGSPAVRLRDGTLLKIGSRYVGSLDAWAV